MKYVEWPHNKCPFPYFSENQMSGLRDCIRSLSPGDVYGDKMESFLKRVSLGEKVRWRLGEYFSNNDINKPEEALEILRGKVSDDDGYTLCSLDHLFGNLKGMTVGKILQLIGDKNDMKISVYKQAGILCITRLEAPLVRLALQKSPKKPEKVRYPVLPSGTPAASVNDELLPELDITRSQMELILRKNPNLRTNVRMSEGSGRRRVVEREYAEGFMTAVRGTEQYRKTHKREPSEPNVSHQERPGEEEIILGTPTEDRVAEVRERMLKRA